MSYAICEQQRRRSAYTSAQSDQRLCCSLPRQNDTSSLYIRNFKILVGSVAEQVSLYLARPETPEDTFSHGVAHIHSEYQVYFLHLCKTCFSHPETNGYI